MEDEDIATEEVAPGGRGAKQHGFLAEERGSGVFHAGVGQAGDEHGVVLGEGKRLREIVGEVARSLGGDLLESRDFRLGAIGGGRPRVDCGHVGGAFELAKGTGGKGEKVSADGLRFGEDRAALVR